MKTLISVAAYLRMSSDKQDTSIADQRTELLAYTAKHGMRIVAWYSDEAISGWKSKERRGFHQLIADAKEGTFKGVVCWDQARFSRFDPMEANYFWHILRTAGVFFETVKEGRIDWDTLGGWLTASVQQHGKAEYVRSLAHDCTRGRRAAVLAGKWITSPPYGYRKEGSKLILGDPKEVETIRRIFEMRAQGMGRPTICATLNKERIPSPGGSFWYATQIRMILTRDTYCGDQRIGRWSKGKFCRITDTPFTNKDTHPAIISRELWERVQKLNATRTNSHASRHGTKLGGPLSGLIVCQKCGATMFFEKRYDRYICSTHATGGDCTNNTIGNATILKLIVNKIRELILLGSQKKLAEHIAKLRGPARKPADRSGDVARQLAEVDRKLSTAAERLLDVDADLVPSVHAAMLKLKERREALAEQAKDAKKDPGRTPQAIAAQVWELDHVLSHGDLQTVRTALAQVIERVELRFEQSSRDRRKWLPVGGTVFFFNYRPLVHVLGDKSTVSSCRKAMFTRKDFVAVAGGG